MSLHFKNPTVLLGYGRNTWPGYPSGRVLAVAQGAEDEVEFSTEDYDLEIILTPKFKPGWFMHKTTKTAYAVTYWDEDPETIDPGQWFRTTEPKEIEK